MLLDVRELCSYCNYQLVVSGRSDRQVDAIATAVGEAVRATGRRAIGVEGVKSGQWALLDFGDLVVHVFHEQERVYYGLERLWKDCPLVPIDLPTSAPVE